MDGERRMQTGAEHCGEANAHVVQLPIRCDPVRPHSARPPGSNSLQASSKTRWRAVLFTGNRVILLRGTPYISV